MIYLDFNKTNSDNNDTTCNIDIQTQLPTNFTKLAVTKADLTVNIPFFTVPLVNPQYHYDLVNKNYNLYSQDEGYYETPYSIYYCDYNNNSIRHEERKIYFKNYEFVDNDKVNSKDNDNNYKIYDNFNNYFVINHFNSFLKSINENINKLLFDMWHSKEDADNLQTLFNTDNNNTLNIFMLSNYQTEGTHILVDNPEDAQTDNTGKKFCLGFNKALYDLLLSPFVYNKYSYNNIEYFSPNNGLVGKGTIFNISLGENKDYDMIELHNNYYIDYIPTFTSIVISFNSNVSPLTVNVRNKNFIYNDKNIADTSLSNIPIIQKFQLNRNTEQIYKLVYNNNSITNNYSSINNLNLQRLTLKIYLQDKYGYLYETKFNNDNEYIYIQLAVFN